MGILDSIRYEVKLYELENFRWNFYVFASTRAGERWSQNIQIGSGSADSEMQAVEKAQEKATADRLKRRREIAAMKTVPLK
jgi:hypothetical protein